MTPKQRDLLIFITDYWAKFGCAPTYSMISNSLGNISKSGVHRLVHALVKRGYLVMVPGAKRSVRLPRTQPAAGEVKHASL